MTASYKYCEELDLIPEKWLASSDGSITLIEAFLLLPVLRYCKTRISQNEQIDNHILLRLTRVLSSLSKDATISKAVRSQVFNALNLVDSLQAGEDIVAFLKKQGISKTILNDELKRKLEVYASSNRRIELEDVFWFAEDLDNNNGEIKHLIDFFIAKFNSSIKDFDVEKFAAFVTTCKELFENEDVIWGDLLGTDVYANNGDRVCYKWDWYKNSDFLNFAFDRLAKESLSLADFLVIKRKQFISNYETEEAVKSEEQPNKQLYIYYIIQNHLIKKAPAWNWSGGRWNFGIYKSYPGFSSSFNKGNVYQSIRDHFRENKQRILFINQSVNKRKISFSELILWANI